MLILRKILNLIAKYNIEMNIERCGYKDGFIISVYRHGCDHNIFISDAELLIYDEDYLLFVIKGMVHEVLEEEQKRLKISEQFKKTDTTVEIKNIF